MDLFELEAVALTGINKVVISHDAHKPGHIAFLFQICTWKYLKFKHA